ncbi:hypothetical protein MRB53_042385 [Persea americana]|nr:hypothetical protein MRB53_042385 [Persea americana]
MFTTWKSLAIETIFNHPAQKTSIQEWIKQRTTPRYWRQSLLVLKYTELAVNYSEPSTNATPMHSTSVKVQSRSRESSPAQAGHNPKEVAARRLLPQKTVIVPQKNIQLTEQQAASLRHFVLNVNLNFTAVNETRVLGTDGLYIQPSNFWNFVIPHMAVHSAPLLHAVLAISALHEANVCKRSEHQALLDYHQSIRKLAKALQEPGAQARDDLLATCLILAYFETMAARPSSGGRHLQGACDLVRARIVSLYGHHQGADRLHFSASPKVVEHLICFTFTKTPFKPYCLAMASSLNFSMSKMLPIRGEPGSITHASDQLRLFLARIGDFACVDRRRKEDQYAGLKELANALNHWTKIMSALQSWHAALHPYFHPVPDSGFSTPSGPAIMYKHPTIASLQMMYGAAILYMHRSHPELSPAPAEAIRMSAGATFQLLKDILCMMTGVMVQSANNRTVDAGSHMKAMINGVLPVFLAGIALQDEEERSYLESILNDVYAMTGWRTVARVLQGLNVAWQRQSPHQFDLNSLDAELNDSEYHTDGVRRAAVRCHQGCRDRTQQGSRSTRTDAYQ